MKCENCNKKMEYIDKTELEQEEQGREPILMVRTHGWECVYCDLFEHLEEDEEDDYIDMSYCDENEE